MARPLEASIPHSLGKEEARRRIQDGFVNVRNKMSTGMFGIFSSKEHWEGDRLHFECGAIGQKITGRLDVRADMVHVEVDLPPLLMALADKIRGVLTTETRKLLTKS
jgi:hypothetical protein